MRASTSKIRSGVRGRRALRALSRPCCRIRGVSRRARARCARAAVRAPSCPRRGARCWPSCRRARGREGPARRGVGRGPFEPRADHDAELRAANDGERVFAAGGERRACRVSHGLRANVLDPAINAATIRLLDARGRRGRDDIGLLRLARASSRPERDVARLWRPVLEQVGSRAARAASTRSSRTRRAAARTRRTTDICSATPLARLPPTRARERARRDGAARGNRLAARCAIRRGHRRLPSACSMQHGQKIDEPPRALLRQAGFVVRESPRRASVLRIGRDVQHSAARDRRAPARAQGRQRRRDWGGHRCDRQHRLYHPARRRDGLGRAHTVELLDWATGGPAPPAWLARRER